MLTILVYNYIGMVLTRLLSGEADWEHFNLILVLTEKLLQSIQTVKCTKLEANFMAHIVVKQFTSNHSYIGLIMFWILQTMKVT